MEGMSQHSESYYQQNNPWYKMKVNQPTFNFQAHKEKKKVLKVTKKITITTLIIITIVLLLILLIIIKI